MGKRFKRYLYFDFFNRIFTTVCDFRSSFKFLVSLLFFSSPKKTINWILNIFNLHILSPVVLDDKFEVDKMKRLLINDFNSLEDVATYRCNYIIDGVSVAIVDYQVYEKQPVITLSPDSEFL